MKGGWVGRLGLAAISTLVALILAEGVLRLVVPRPWGRSFEELVEQLPIAWTPHAFVPDAALGYKPAPDFRGRMARRDEFDVRFRTNALGLRDGPIGPIGSAARVLFVGDSFVFGSGVEQRETFVARSASLLAETEPGGFELINGGVGGYGIDQYALWMRRLLPQVEPDLVVLCIFVGNDLVRYPAPEAQPVTRAIVARDGFRVRNRGELGWALRRWSALGFFVLQRIDSREPAVQTGTFEQITRSIDPYLDQIQRDVTAGGGRLAAVVIPDRVQFRSEPGSSYASQEQARLLYSAWATWLVRAFEQREVPVLNLTEVFLRVRGASPWFPVDGHFTAEGHDIAAAAIAPWLAALWEGPLGDAAGRVPSNPGGRRR